LRVELQQEVASLRNELHAQHECQIEATGQALGGTAKDLEATIKKIEHELFSLVERRFAALEARLDIFMPESSRSKDFKFASERVGGDGGADVIDLPNPLRRRGLN
jgi:hypothetical protein